MKRAHMMLRWLLMSMMLVAAGGYLPASAQTKQTDDKTLQELLNEVRMLRQALQTLQRMSVDTYRSQLLVDRIRANREDIRRLQTSLNETRETLFRTQQTIPNFTEQQKMIESRLQVEVDQAKRVEWEYELKRTKSSIEMYKSQLEPLREREQQLSAELASEKTKLDELESRLDMLERTIENDRQKVETDKPGPVKTP